MNLEKLVLKTRVRNGWSAIDLGVALARRYWLRCALLWLALAVPVYALLELSNLSWDWFTLVAIWWFKPLFERPILHLLSREIFSEKMPFWRVLKEYRLWLWPGLFWALSLRRINTGRALYAPIMLLEQPKRSEYGGRATVLGSKFSSEATWLNIVFVHIESIAMFGLLALILMVTDSLSEFWVYFVDPDQSTNRIYDLVALFSMAAIAPFYVAGGFMLYISRRIELEGWDIEICFRDWMSQHADQAPVNTAASASS